jgi:hypothetical protein
MRRAGLLLGLLMGTAAIAAPAPDAVPDPEQAPEPGGVLIDRDFGVRSRQFGLERRVEMYQWRRMPDGYRPVWNGAPIDSGGFPPEYRNPRALPIRSERWWADDATLAGRPIHREVLATLGRWVEFRPDFERLPSNLAAAFQPEGNGLGSSENPLEPVIGDVRIRWHELLLPELEGRVELREGVWRLTPTVAAHAVAPAEPVVVIDPPDARLLRDRWSWLVGGLALVIVAGVVLRGRRGRDD